jgi:RHS repeat-associated protein
MLIPSHLQLEPSNSRTRVPAGGIDLIASIDFGSDGANAATLSSSTKLSQGEDAILSAEAATPNHSNQQYSIYAITDAAANIAERYAYTAYGQPTILNAAATVLTASAIGNRYTYTAREWDATVGLYHFRARWMSGLTGRFLTRDPIGFVGRSLGLYQYSRSRTLRYVDPSGLIEIAYDGDPTVNPPFTNCIGYCVHPTEDFVIPSTTIQKMLDFFKLECNSRSGGGEDCLAKCRENLAAGGQGCSQLVIYIVDISPAVTRRVQAILEEMRNAGSQQDYEFLLKELWFILADRLGKDGGSGQDPIDIHMSKCNPKFPYEYEMQMGQCKKGTRRDKTDYFFPTPDDPEVIDPKRILFKTCCCK